MDRAILDAKLLDAERHVADSEQFIAHLRQTITDDEQRGENTATTKRTLANFETAQEMHLASRARIIEQIRSISEG